MKNSVLINFINLTSNEKEMVLAWRNHPNIKRWMYTQEDISLENHLNFIKSLENNNEKLYFLVKKEDEYIGVIDFTDLHNSHIYFGLYANPMTKVLGVGRILEQISIDYAFDVLKVNGLQLEVFADNIQVRNLHKKFNFKETGTKMINNKEVICMELKNENR